jgi:5-formyltetrahydrofolate cyclo-ligase
MLAKKTHLRKIAIEKRNALSASARLRAAEEAARHALPLIEHERNAVVAIYWPVRNEISPLILAEHLHARKFELCLPVVVEKDAPLRFRKYEPGYALHKGKYGIDEPSQKSPYLNPSILIVPLIAFDKKGRRLGTGGGYYDRTLQALRAGDTPIKAYGYAFAIQEAVELPHEPHDELLDAVITEQGIR